MTITSRDIYHRETLMHTPKETYARILQKHCLKPKTNPKPGIHEYKNG